MTSFGQGHEEAGHRLKNSVIDCSGRGAVGKAGEREEGRGQKNHPTAPNKTAQKVESIWGPPKSPKMEPFFPLMPGQQPAKGPSSRHPSDIYIYI